MHKTIYSLIGGLAIVTAAAGLTELTLGHGSLSGLSDGSRLVSTPASSPRVTVTQSTTPTPTASPVPSLTPTPAPTVTATPAGPTATTNGYVRLRAEASTASAIVAELDGGTVVQLGVYRDSQWQQVTVNGQSGYIYRSYLNY